ncbi:MAG TPA: hypothetical protein VN608_05375 [Clostridia bacterium]|nr:hypothetical protein [Clostridia bacterium]
MWSNTISAFIVSVRVKKNRALEAMQLEGCAKDKKQRGFLFWLALPMPVLLMFVDMAEDLVLLISPFINSSKAKHSTKLVWALMRFLKEFAMELCFETGPTDFVDVDVRETDENVRVRVLTR